MGGAVVHSTHLPAITQTRRRSPATIPFSLWIFGLLVLSIILLRVFVPIAQGLGSKTGLTDTSAEQDFIATLAQVLAELLGFTISVVAIVVQLSASRFTPKVTELFLREKVNLLVILFLTTADIICVWTLLSFGFSEQPDSLIWLNFVLGTLSFVILIPYFIFIFNFLQPTSIIYRIEKQFEETIDAVNLSGKRFNNIQQKCLSILDDFKGIATNAIQQRESQILIDTLSGLKAIAFAYVHQKQRFPEHWFAITPAIYRDPSFTSIDKKTLQAIEAQKIWLEIKILRQYQTIFSDSLNFFREACYIVAIYTREIAEQAFEKGDRNLAQIAVKFFNTYFREVISAPDIRVGYTLSKEYRLLAEAALVAQDFETVIKIANYFRYYCFLANRADLEFLPETFAYDLGLLAQRSCEAGSKVCSEILETFLKIDQDPESVNQENTLRGIRKSQVKLATYYLKFGYLSLAEVVFEDMKGESEKRLKVIFNELDEATADFWEFRDRGGENFYYVEPELKPYLYQFMNWFESSKEE